MRGARKEAGKQMEFYFPLWKNFFLNQIDQCSFSGSLKLQKGNLLSHEKFIFFSVMDSFAIVDFVLLHSHSDPSQSKTISDLLNGFNLQQNSTDLLHSSGQ